MTHLISIKQPVSTAYEDNHPNQILHRNPYLPSVYCPKDNGTAKLLISGMNIVTKITEYSNRVLTVLTLSLYPSGNAKDKGYLVYNSA